MTQVKELFEKITQNVSTAVIGREASINLAVIALLARGHVLLEDVPGSGKTLLAKSEPQSYDCGSEYFLRSAHSQTRFEQSLDSLSQHC